MKRLLIIAAMSLFAFSCTAQKVDNSTVKSLDIQKFQGEWYEIARFDHSFERGMFFPRTEYKLMPDGKIRVTNSGIKLGKMKVSVGKAKTTETPGLLRVSFFGPFYSDYRVMMIVDDYQYALIGGGSSKYLWILSRTPIVPDNIKFRMVTEAGKRGYDVRNLIWMDQLEEVSAITDAIENLCTWGNLGRLAECR